MSRSAMSPSPRLLALAVLCSVVWTSAFVAGKYAMAWLDVESLLGLRFALTAVVLLPFILSRPWRARETVFNGLVLGLLINVATLTMAFHGMAHIGSSMVVILTSCAPFITLLLAVAIGTERLDAGRLGGIALGFVGVVVICGPRVSGHADLAGLLLAGGAAITFSISTLWTRQRATGQDPLVLTTWQAIAGAVALLPFAHPGAVATMPLQAWLAIGWLALVVSIGAILLRMYLVRTMGASRAASLHLMNPVFGLLLGWWFFGETVGWLDLPGLVLVGSGILLATRSVREPAPAPRLRSPLQVAQQGEKQADQQADQQSKRQPQQPSQPQSQLQSQPQPQSPLKPQSQRQPQPRPQSKPQQTPQPQAVNRCLQLEQQA